jgi:plastocyanin domain-containing protein
VVSNDGFNDTQGEFRLEVQKGQEVEIIFIYGDDDLSVNNLHIISIPTFGITTDILDQENAEVTASFTASDTGEVHFMCIQRMCNGHSNLQGGIVLIQ